MSETDKKSPKPSTPGRERMKSGDGKSIANKIVKRRTSTDYKDLKTKETLKKALLERDDELFVLARDYRDQAKKLKKLKQEMLLKKMEVSSLKVEAQEAKERADRMSHALTSSVENTSNLMASLSKANDKEQEKEEKENEREEEVSPKDDTASPKDDPAKPEDNPDAYMRDPEYIRTIKQIDPASLDMILEADKMTPSAETEPVDGEKFRYAVPMHLMGLILGKHRVTIKRIIHQTATEIEQCSWAEGVGNDARRVMGFEIIGSADAVRKAIDAMIKVVRESDAQKVSRILSGHIRAQEDPPKGGKPKKAKNQGAAKPGPRKSYGANPRKPYGENPICRFYRKGYCKYGIKCKESHSRGTRK